MKPPIDPERMRLMEHTARGIADALARAISRNPHEHWGFALFLFSFEGSELTYISNANREDMLKMLHEFIAANPPAKTWDEQHG